MNAKEKLQQLNQEQAQEFMKMAELGYKLMRPQQKTTTSHDSAYQALMSMIGCTDAKEKIKEVLAQARMYKINRARGRPAEAAHYHMVFLGPPGSCKTSTARLYSEILCSEGVTRTRQLVQLTKANLVGRYQGETPNKIKQLFEEHRGSTILIDEAYSLDDSNAENSYTYGSEAINEIIVQLEDVTDTVVIFAGYPEKMQRFLETNPGLRSRIPITVTFPDYTTLELLEIVKKVAKDRGYLLKETAENKISRILDIARKEENFGNGRYCRNLVEKAISLKSIQLGITNEDFDLGKYVSEDISDEELYMLDEDCFETLIPIPVTETRTIGF